MQYDLDSTSECSTLFLYLRKIILSHKEITEEKRAKQTSYKDRYSTVCMLRVRQKMVRVSFANGARLQEMFNTLKGEAKIVRYLEYRNIKDVDIAALNALIKESLILNIEKDARRQLTTSKRRSK